MLLACFMNVGLRGPQHLRKIANISVPVLCCLVDDDFLFLLLDLYFLWTYHFGPSHFYMNLLHAVWYLPLFVLFLPLLTALLSSSLFVVEFVALNLLLVSQLNGVLFLQQEQLLDLNHCFALDILTHVTIFNFHLHIVAILALCRWLRCWHRL